MEIGFTFLVGSHGSPNDTSEHLVEGFSRGAYQARAIAGMIHRVRCLDVSIQPMIIDVSLGRFDSSR